MKTNELDHTFATLEHAADHAHLAQFEKSEITQKLKGALASALGDCIAAASDLERFLAHAAPAATDRDLHHLLYDAAKQVGDMPAALRDALRSVDAFAELGGTAAGLLERAGLEVKVALEGHSDRMLRGATDEAFLRALETYDRAVEQVARTRSGFLDLVLEQRKALARLQRHVVPA